MKFKAVVEFELSFKSIGDKGLDSLLKDELLEHLKDILNDASYSYIDLNAAYDEVCNDRDATKYSAKAHEEAGDIVGKIKMKGKPKISVVKK